MREKHPDWDDEKISLETYKKYSGKTDREANSKEAIQNRLLDMYIASISNPLQYSESRQPLDAVTSYLTDKVLGDIDKLQKSKQGASRLQLTTATPGFQNRTKADLIAGKTNLGAFALSNSHHMLAQAVALVTQGHKSINHLHINKLNGIYSQDPNFHDKQTIVTLISDWISAMINAHVDVAKDPYINRLNVRKFTINVTNYLLRAGKGESTFYFLSQKILRDIADEFEALSGYYGVEDAIGGAAYAAKSKVENKYKQALIDRFGLSLPEIKKRITKLTSIPEFNAFDIKMLQKFMPEENTANWYIQQLAILETYEAIEPSARALSENTKLSQIDTKKFGNNYALQQNFLMKMAEFAQTDKVFADPLSVIRHTFLRQKLFDALIRPRQYMSKVLLRTTLEFENKRRKLYQITGRHMMSSDKYVNDITRMMEASYKAKFWMQYAADNGLKVASLFAGENSVPRRLYKIKQMIQSQPELGLLNSDGSFANILLDSISMMLKTDKQDMKLPDFIQFKHNKSDDHNLDDHLIRAWEELLELNAANETLQPQVDAIKTFARDLAIYAFFTSGDAFGKNNIFKYVPESFRESSGYYDYIRKLEAEPSEMLTKISEEDVIRNLWWNDEVIPAHNIFNEKYEETDRGIEPTYSINSWYIPSNITVKKGKDELNVPQILSLNKGKVIGKNDKGQILYQPYVKVDFGSKNNPLTTFVYKFVGTRDTEILDKNGNPTLTKDGKPITVRKPIYSLITKKGIKHKGKVLVEPSGKVKSLLTVNNVLEFPNDWFKLNGAKYGIEPNLSLVPAVESGYTGEIEYLTSKLFTTELLDEAIDREDLPEDIRQYLAPDEKEATQIVRESVELAKQGLKITNELGEFFTKEELDLIKQATKDKRLFVKSASRRTDPVFFTEEIIKQLKENDKLPFGHPDRFYAIEIWSKHDGIPMVDLIDACIKYRVAPMHSFSISTLGNSELEPGVLKSDDLLDEIQNLINDGKINPKTTTIRIDPLLPGVTKLEDIERVVKRASEMGITKFVSSVMQSYGWTEKSKHPRGIVPALKSRINYDWAKYYKILPDGTVNNKPKEEAVKPFSDKLHELIDKYGVEIKSCASNNLKLEEAACLDPIVLENLTGVEIDKNYKDKTRLECMCYGAHGDMLKYSDVCLSCCAYCYAAQQNDGLQYQYYDENGNKLDLALTRTSRLPQVNLDKKSDESVSLVSESNNPADSTEVNTSFPSTINIYAGTGENAAVTDAKLAQEFEQFVAETSTWYDEQDVKSVQKELSELPKAKPTPSFTFADGTKIDTPFELNDQQKFALLELEKFYNSSESFFSLQGYAGTGKTTIMKIFDAYLKKKKDKPLYLAPTHKANSVTKANNPEASTSTVHSVLGLVPEYDMASEKFDASKMKFNDPGEIGIEPETVVILDECSMVPDELADFICSAIEETQSKIIFLGDPAQLSPVGQNKLSKTFEMNSKVELTKVERTGDNSILKEATNLREGKTLSYQTELNQKGDGIMFTKNANTVAIYLKSIINSDEFKNNPLHFRVLSGVNASIPVYNNLIRTLLYGKDAPFLVEGELLMGYSNEQKNRKGSKRPYNIMNSGDYSVVKVGESITKEVPHTDGLEVKGRMVLLHEVTSQYPINVFILDPSTSAKTIRAIKLTIDGMWATYRRLNSEGRRGEAVEQLTKINEIQNSFSTMKDIIDEETGRLIRKKTFDYGYTHTVHKSQGATYDKVLVLGDSFNVFDRNTQQQLKYVAITRAKQQVMYIAPTSSSVNPQALSEVTKEKWAEIQERVNKCK